MAAPITYVWKPGDRLWRVCGILLPRTGYTGTVALKEAIIGLNNIPNSLNIPPGTVLYIPVKAP